MTDIYILCVMHFGRSEFTFNSLHVDNVFCGAVAIVTEWTTVCFIVACFYINAWKVHFCENFITYCLIVVYSLFRMNGYYFFHEKINVHLLDT